MKTTFESLQAILARDHKLEVDQITPDSTLESLGIDSLGVADLLFNVEDEFHVTVPAEPVEGLATVGDVAHFIDGLLAAKASATRATDSVARGDPPTVA